MVLIEGAEAVDLTHAFLEPRREIGALLCDRVIRTTIGAAALVACALSPLQAGATLVLSPDGTTVYDTVKNVSWLADSDLAATNTTTPTSTSTSTPTVTNTLTPTPTPPPTATPTHVPCVGDCNGNHQVTVDELLTMVNIALGNTPAATCAAGDANHDGQITVDEILTAVDHALNGCPPPRSIVSISICTAGSGSSGSCPSGSADSLQPVLAPAAQGGGVIDSYGGLFGITDEHATILPPGTFPGHASDYLFLAASDTTLGSANGAGLVVLTGGAGPDANDQWTLDFAHEYGLYKPTNPVGSQNGQLFLAAMGHGNCPIVSNPTLQDPTFDINYAAPGSVVIDPTNPNNTGPGNVLMIYEGTTYCFGVSGSGVSGNFYSTIGIATSLDHGVTWPTYRSDWVPLPGTNKTLGPNAPLGAFGSNVCMGNDYVTTPPVNYGRYAALNQPVTAAAVMSTGQPLGNTVGNNMGNSEPSAFVDDVKANGNPYLYIVSRYDTGPTDLGGFHFGPSAVTGGISVARAQLNGGSAPLQFMKWFGPTVSYANGTASGSFAEQMALPPGVTCSAGTCPPYPSNKGLGSAGGGLESPLFPTNPNGGSKSASYKTCQAAGQIQWMPSISYVEATQDYLLVFVCLSPSDPSTQTGTAGAAWFYSTLDATQYDLSNQDKWSAPQEIIASWSPYDSTFLCSATNTFQNYSGWYPSLMSMGLKPGHLSTSGYVFFLKGCAGGGSGRQFSSRTFTITTN